MKPVPGINAQQALFQEHLEPDQIIPFITLRERILFELQAYAIKNKTDVLTLTSIRGQLIKLGRFDDWLFRRFFMEGTVDAAEWSQAVHDQNAMTVDMIQMVDAFLRAQGYTKCLTPTRSKP